MIRLGNVNIGRQTVEFVTAALNEGKIGQTDIICEFENRMAKWLRVRHCVATSSGTMADTVALAVLKYMNPRKDEVLLPALTFIAQANAVYYNHLKPVFVDLTPGTFTINSNVVSEKVSSKTLCVFPTHLLGYPAEMTDFMQIGRYSKTYVVEDCCEALGSIYDYNGAGGSKCGGMGDMGTFSFFPSHTITTGEGGMIATDSEELATLCRKFINHGRTSTTEFHFDAIGFNGKMSSLQAAVGLGNIELLDEAVKKRRQNLLDFGFVEPHGSQVVPHGMPFMAKDEKRRDAILEMLRGIGIECRNLFSCIPTQEPAYSFLGHKLGDFPVAEGIGRRGYYLPIHDGLNDHSLDKIRGVVAMLREMQ